MSLSHEEVLAEIEGELQASGVAPEEVDARVAEALDVPLDYYLAYLLVWCAIAAQREIRALSEESRSSLAGDNLEAGGFEVELG